MVSLVRGLIILNFKIQRDFSIILLIIIHFHVYNKYFCYFVKILIYYIIKNLVLYISLTYATEA